MSLALDVARAALMEVGEEPGLVIEVPDPIVPGRVVLRNSLGNTLARRAGLLGLLAEHGPNYLVRCAHCAPRGQTSPACTPIRDVLRGVTCGRGDQ